LRAKLRQYFARRLGAKAWREGLARRLGAKAWREDLDEDTLASKSGGATKIRAACGQRGKKALTDRKGPLRQPRFTLLQDA
jgi:hypothetical protein